MSATPLRPTRWRIWWLTPGRALQEQFNPASDSDNPFYELIWFSDCEGTIGSEAAAELLVDFRELSPACRPPHEWYGDVFNAFKRASLLAADDGLIGSW